MKFKLKLYVQSQSDIITNSSSEIFCQIQSNSDTIKSIATYLNSIGCKCDVCDWEEGNEGTIDFWIEYIEEIDRISKPFVALLKAVLDPVFGENNYKIETDVPL